MEDVKEKWAFVTGASRGIGYLIAKTMAQYGCNLILHSRKAQHTQKIEKELQKYDVIVKSVACELSQLTKVKKMLTEIDSFNLRVDFVFNNAGLQIAYRKNYLDTPVSDFTVSFNVNTIAPAMITYHFLKQMQKNGYGRIINVTSGINKEPEQAGYSASKAALNKITKDLVSKFANQNIIISLFDPDWCKTDLGGQYAPNEVESTLPGSVIGAFTSNSKSGRIILGQEYAGLDLSEAVEKFENSN